MRKVVLFQSFLLAFIFVVLQQKVVFATHIVGGELTYTYLGIDASNPQRPFRFKIKLVAYIDRNSNLACGCLNNCSGGVNANSTVCNDLNYFGVYNATNGQRIDRLSMPLSKDNNAAPVPPAGCVVPGLLNLEISRVFGEVEINLPFSPDGFHIVYQRCCRNDDLLTLLNPGAAGNTFHCFIPNPLLGNSSPQFTDVNLPFFCKGDTATFNNNAFDPDGDRLIYSFVAAYNSSGTANFDCNNPNNPNCPPQNFSFPPSNVIYRTNQGYTPTNMFGTTGFASINPSSGFAKLYSSIAGQFLVTVEIKEYRTLPDGTEILINSTRRELQFIVRDCPPSPCKPSLNDIAGGSFPSEVNVQSGQDVSFPVVFKLNNTGTPGNCQTDSLKLSASGSIFDNSFGFQGPFASFTEKDSVGTVSSKFDWSTNCSMSGVYYINLKADYRGCPPTTLNQTVAINVIPPPAMGQIFGATALCEGASNQLYRIQTQLPDSSFTWSISGGGVILGHVKNDSVRITWNTPGLHTIKVKQISPGGCSDSITLVVNVAQRVPIHAGVDQTICQGNSTTITVSGGYPPNYTISPSGSFNTATSTFTVTPNSSTNYIITSQNAVGCISRDTVSITVIPRGARVGTPKTICQGLSTQIGEAPLSGYTYLWNGNNISNATIANPTVSPTNTTSAPLTFKYILTATHTATNCVSKDSVLVTVNPSPITNLPDTQHVCANVVSSIGVAAQTGFTYQWLTTTGMSNPNTANPSVNFINNTNGFLYFTYVLQTTNTTTSCVSVDTTVIAVRPAVMAEAGNDKTNCLNIPIQIGASPQLGLTYSWSPATGLNDSTLANPTVAQNTVGTYKYVLTVTNAFGCIGKDSVNVTITPSLTANAGEDRTICSGATTFLGITPQAGVVYSWLPSTGLSNPNISNPALTLSNTSTSAQTFTYILSVSDNQGLCASSDTVLITVNTLPAPTANAGADTAVCSGTVLGAGSNPIANYSYVWTPAANLSATNIANPSINAINNGATAIFQRYLLEVTDNSNGCKSLDSLVIQVNPLPVANAGTDRTICAGNSINFGSGLFPTPNLSYLWTPATFLNDATTLNPTLTAPINAVTESITYVLTVTNNTTTCSRKDSAVVTINALPTANAGIDKTICSGGNTQLGTPAMTGNTYAWSPTTGLATPNQAQTLVSRTYTGSSVSTNFEYILTVTSDANCVKRDTVLLTVNKLPNADAGNNITLCSNDTGLIGTPAITGYAYSWTSLDGATLIGANQAQPSVTAQVGSFTTFRLALQVTEVATNCSNTDTVVVSINPLPIANVLVSQDTICANDSTIFTGTGGVSYIWSNGATTNNIIVKDTNDYTVRAISAQGCTSAVSAPVSIFLIDLPVANAGSDIALCVNDTASLGAAAIPNYQYAWTPSAGLSANNVPNPNFSSSVAVTTTYTLTVTDLTTACKNTNQVSVIVYNRPTVSAGLSQSFCSGESVLLNGDTTTDIPITILYWTPDMGLSDPGNLTPTLSLTTTSDTVITYTLTAFNNQGCGSFSSISVSVKALPSANAGEDLITCPTTTDTLGVDAVVVGATYTWQQQNNTIASGLELNKLNITLNNTGNSAFTIPFVLTVEDTNSCKNKDTVLVTVLPPTPAFAGNDTAICFGDSIQLGTTPLPNLSYSWANITAVVANPIVTPLANTTYIVTVTNDTTSCQNKDSVNITVNPLPSAHAGNDVNICVNDTAEIGLPSVAIYTFQWTPTQGIIGLTNGNTASVTWNTDTTVNYILQTTEIATGCQATDTVQVTVLPLPFVNAGTDVTICSGDSIVIGTPNIASHQYAWSPATGLSPTDTIAQPWVSLNIASNAAPTTNLYVLTATGANGCTAKDSVIVTVNPTPLPDSIIKTADVVCPGVENVLYRVNGQTGLNYTWQVNGGTIVSGQNTDSIFVNWGANNPAAKVFVTVSNSFNCNSTKDSVTISVNPNLEPALPLGDTVMCLWDAQNVLYQTSFTNGATYTWQSNDVTTNFVNGTGSNVLATWQTDGVKKLWVTETDTTNLAFCWGVSDTLLVTVHPNPDSTLSLVVNNENPCLNTNDVFTLNGLINSSYVWQIITPSTNSTDSNTTITVNWNEVGTHNISVIETTDKGCVGKPIAAIITVRPIPAPTLVGNDTTICPQTLENRTYNVIGFNHSIFNWLIQGGNATSINSNSITLNWNENAPIYQLNVVETSEFGCVSDTVRFNFLQDRTRLNLRYVTTQVENDKNMQIVWSLLEGTNYNNPISLQKWVNSTWQTIQNGANSDTVFIDANLNTENQIYTYRLQGVNRCGVSINSAAHSSILLSGTANNADNSVRLNWTSYQGWNGTNSILRNNDNRGFTLLQNVSIDTTFTAPIGKDGFNQCFRVLARETNGTGLSYSNIVCLDYENQLIIPNIITPNNDAKNETWDMDNRQLYQVEVEIYNRWGKKLYNNSNYQGDWKADNLPSGIYFYRIKYTAKGMTYEKNGYLNVVR